MTDREELRRLAQAATPGPWGNTDVSDPTRINSPYDQVAICYRTSRAIVNAKFIAAANPTAVLSLLDEIERLRAEIETMKRQEPAGEAIRYWLDAESPVVYDIRWYEPTVDVPTGTKLYLAPGAQGGQQ